MSLCTDWKMCLRYPNLRVTQQDPKSIGKLKVGWLHFRDKNAASFFFDQLGHLLEAI